jgi:hypothetical protein
MPCDGCYDVLRRTQGPLSSWIGGEVKSKPGSFDYPEPEPHTFEDSLIRNLAAAFRKINKTPIY